MNFTFVSLEAAQHALKKLRQEIVSWEEPAGRCQDFEDRFLEALNDDLNTSQALSVMWDLVKSDNPTGAKAASLFKMDEVLGLQLQAKSLSEKQEQGIVPDHIKALVAERESLRKEKRFNAADQIRSKITTLGYEIEDSKKGVKVKKII